MKARERKLGAWSALLLLSAGAAASQGGSGQGPVGPQQEPPEVGSDSQEELQRQIIELVHAVERRLGSIDRRLSDASVGVAPLEDVENSGIDELLRQAAQNSQQNVQDIDSILEIASRLDANQQSSGGGQQSQMPQQGESPLDSERDRGPQEREETPSEPTPQPGHEPKDEPRPDQNPPEGENRPGTDRADRGSGMASTADDANRWGELPVRYREVFRNQGGAELPVQYREWIDAYHRRLSKTRR